MARFTQILVVLAVIQCLEEVNGAPLLQGVKITRNFDIDFKPFQFRPFSYIREKWGPFGAFGKKHVITKRETLDSIGTVNITPPSPSSQPTGSIVSPEANTGVVPPPLGPAFDNPAPVVEVRPDNPPPPVSISPIPISSVTPPAITNEIFQPEVNIASQGNALPPNFRSFFNPSAQNRPTGLNTDIFRFQPTQNVNPTPIFDNSPYRVNLLPPSPPPPPSTGLVAPAVNQPVPEAPAIGGGGVIARLFGEFFLQLLSRLITNARSSFSRLSPAQ